MLKDVTQPILRAVFFMHGGLGGESEGGNGFLVVEMTCNRRKPVQLTQSSRFMPSRAREASPPASSLTASGRHEAGPCSCSCGASAKPAWFALRHLLSNNDSNQLSNNNSNHLLLDQL